jgi:hypothetical protein
VNRELVSDKVGADSEPFLQPWQFFLLGGMLAATATVIVATGQSAANIIILSLTVVAVSFVGLGAYRILVPLVSSTDIETPTLIGGRTRIALEREKQLVLRSIKELEFDFAMGKMSQADFDEMSGRLRRRAVGLMRQLDEGGGYREQIERELERRLKEIDADAPGRTSGSDRLSAFAEASADRRSFSGGLSGLSNDSSDALVCQCGTANDPDARFCKSCGTRLSPDG